MNAEEHIDDKKKPSPEELKRSRTVALTAGVFLIVALIGFVYSLKQQSDLNSQIKEQQVQIDSLHVQLQNRDSLLSRAVRESRLQAIRAEKNLSKANPKEKQSKATKKKKKS